MEHDIRFATTWKVVLGGFCLVACDPQPELPAPGELLRDQAGPAPATPSITVATWPSGDVTQALPVVQFFVAATSANGALDPRSVVLVKGLLSDAALRKLAKRDRTESVDKNHVELTVTAAAPDRIVAAPTQPLGSGDYTLAVGSATWKTEVHVDEPDSPLPTLQRRWPVGEMATSGTFAILCADQPLPDGWSVASAPWPTPLRTTAGIFGEFAAQVPCVTVTAPPTTLPWSPPPALVNSAQQPTAWLDPTPVQPQKPKVQAATDSCAPPCTKLGAVCMEVQDDRIQWHAGAEPLLLAVTLEGSTTLHGGTGLPGVRRGLRPATTYSLEVVSVNGQGDQTKAYSTVVTAAEQPHVVINEVLANPRGPEPASEWVELFNDGTGAVNLAGWTFGDDQNQAVLPDQVVPAGSYVLLVSAGYAPGASGDERPMQGTPLVPVKSLGRGGISNSGEALYLRNAAGRVVSTFPAVRSPQAGVSVIRKRPDVGDDDETGFGPAPRGASPGRENY